MKEETKAKLQAAYDTVFEFFAAHKGVRYLLIGIALGLLACWLF